MGLLFVIYQINEHVLYFQESLFDSLKEFRVNILRFHLPLQIAHTFLMKTEYTAL